MHATREVVLEILYKCIDELNEQLAGEQRLRRDPATRLLGDGALDSLGFVNLVVLAEDRCERTFGVSLSLTESARKEQADPFDTVGTLADFMCTLLRDGKAIED